MIQPGTHWCKAKADTLRLPASPEADPEIAFRKFSSLEFLCFILLRAKQTQTHKKPKQKPKPKQYKNKNKNTHTHTHTHTHPKDPD